MNLHQRIRDTIPHWAVGFAFHLRCLLRRSVICRKIPHQKASGKPALIVAPHPDDETFSCGALISLKVLMGVPVRVVFLTNGEEVASAAGEEKKAVIKVRRTQAIAACRCLGVKPVDIRWLNLPDSKLPRSGQSGFDKAVNLLAAQVMEFSPGEIFCPHPEDRHSDHVAASELVREAIHFSRKPCNVIHYPIWMWYHASLGLSKRLIVDGAWRLDGKTVKARKKAAISAYLDGPKTLSGMPYCGKLPWSFLWNFQRRNEVFFDALP